jgi:hypothetical protein
MYEMTRNPYTKFKRKIMFKRKFSRCCSEYKYDDSLSGTTDYENIKNIGEFCEFCNILRRKAIVYYAQTIPGRQVDMSHVDDTDFVYAKMYNLLRYDVNACGLISLYHPYREMT